MAKHRRRMRTKTANGANGATDERGFRAQAFREWWWCANRMTSAGGKDDVEDDGTGMKNVI